MMEEASQTPCHCLRPIAGLILRQSPRLVELIAEFLRDMSHASLLECQVWLQLSQCCCNVSVSQDCLPIALAVSHHNNLIVAKPGLPAHQQPTCSKCRREFLRQPGASACWMAYYLIQRCYRMRTCGDGSVKMVMVAERIDADARNGMVWVYGADGVSVHMVM